MEAQPQKKSMNNAKEDKKRGDIFIGFIVFICFVLLIYVVVKMGGVSVWERTRADQGKAGGRSALALSQTDTLLNL